MNLTAAFTQRNRLKRYIADYSVMLKNNIKTFSHIEPDEQMWPDNKNPWTQFSGKSYDQVVGIILTAKERLGELNTIIDKANVAARPLLNKIETLKSQYATVSNIAQYVKATPAYEMYKEGGPYSDEKAVRVKVITDTDVDYDEKAKRLTKEIQKAEDELSVMNGKTSVKIPAELQDYLDSYELD